MKPEEIVERLCKLQGLVSSAHGYKHAGDCFCKKGGYWGMENGEEYYMNDGFAIEFIENAVKEKLGKL